MSRDPTTSRNYTVSLWFTLASTNHMLEKVLFPYNRRYLIEMAFRNDRWCFITYALSPAEIEELAGGCPTPGPWA